MNALAVVGSADWWPNIILFILSGFLLALPVGVWAGLQWGEMRAEDKRRKEVES